MMQAMIEAQLLLFFFLAASKEWTPLTVHKVKTPGINLGKN
jgi:hypothetical protein